jgi:DNA-binding CsgD family transcriptional regulator
VLASETLLPAQALRATWAGDFARAYGLLAKTAEQQISASRQSQRHAEIALYAAAAGLFVEAEAALRAAVATAFKGETHDRSGALANAYVALTLVLLGRHRQAARVLSDLRRSGLLTSRLGVVVSAIWTINDRWKRGRYSTDLRDTLRQLDAGDFGGIGRLIEALPLPETYRARFARLAGPERDVLAHLSAGRQTPQIAALCGYSAETVDAAIKALCRKLGCSSPRQAIALTRSAGLLRRRMAHAR